MQVYFIRYLLAKMQPMYAMANRNSNVIEESGDWLDAPSIVGKSGIVMKMSTGTIFYKKNMCDIHYPASIAKIITARLTIKNGEMDETVTVPPEAVYLEGKETYIALDAEEQLSFYQSLSIKIS